MRIKGWFLERVPLQYHVPLRYWYRFFSGRLEKELKIVTRLVAPGHVSIDIGAHYGVYTYVLSKLSRQVEAFEPVPQCALTIAAFGAANVRVHQVALSARTGAKDLFIPREGPILHSALASFTAPVGPFETVPVSVRRLDDYGFDDVSLIKIDVEGHELDVLRGAKNTIAKSNPILLVEIEQRHLSIPLDSVFDELGHFGYRGFFVAGRRILPLSEFSYRLHQQPFLHNVLSNEYVNNFIFLPRNSGSVEGLP
jgi:FkbM family methyltransferase